MNIIYIFLAIELCVCRQATLFFNSGYALVIVPHVGYVIAVCCIIVSAALVIRNQG